MDFLKLNRKRKHIVNFEIDLFKKFSILDLNFDSNKDNNINPI